MVFFQCLCLMQFHSNQLIGSDSAVAVTAGQVQVPGSNPATFGTPYVLGIVGDVLRFYEFTGTSIPAHKAYFIQ